MGSEAMGLSGSRAEKGEERIWCEVVRRFFSEVRTLREGRRGMPGSFFSSV